MHSDFTPTVLSGKYGPARLHLLNDGTRATVIKYSLYSVLSGLPKEAITRAIIMDHLYAPLLSLFASVHALNLASSDWFAPGAGEVDEEVAEIHRVLSPGGMVFWRSAARHPWYNEVFERVGFTLEVLGMREGPHKAIDRVNMCVFGSYYSFTLVSSTR